MTTATEDQLRTTAEVAERLRRSDSTIRYWRLIGYGPPSFKIGRRVMFRAGDVEVWLGKLRAEQATADGAA